MAVGYYNNWDNVLNKLQSLYRTEFKGALKVYKGIRNDTEGNQYLRFSPISSDLVEYSAGLETREFGIGISLYFKEPNMKKNGIDNVMRLISRIETIAANNYSMTLSDGSLVYNCRIESTEIETTDTEYLVAFEYRCVHANDVTSDTTAPTMTITASEVSDGGTSYDATLSMIFTSNENTTDFTSSDVAVGGGSIGSFSGSGKVYTATLTPSAVGDVTVDVDVNKFTDNAGNQNTAATQFNWNHQTNNKSLSLDGTDDYVKFGNVDFSEHEVGSISMWVKPAALPSGSDRSYLIAYQVDTDHYVSIYIGNATSESNKWTLHLKSASETHYFGYADASAVADTWTHLVCVQNGSDGKVYINGDEQTGDTLGTNKWFDDIGASATTSGYDGLTVGTLGGGGNYNGLIDDIAIFDTALSGANINTLYNSGIPKNITGMSGLQGYWRFEESSGDVSDESDNSNDGSLENGATRSTTVPSV